MKPLLLSKTVNYFSRGRLKYGWWTSSYQSQDNPVIIGGCSRSGTTVLRAMLNAHPEIVIGPETGLFCGNLNLEQLSDTLSIDQQSLRTIYLRSGCLAEFVERIMAEQKKRAHKPRWGEKSPCNVLSIALIFQFFPRARFIHAIRDGRDVICSLRTHPKYMWKDCVRVPTNIVNAWPSCVNTWVHEVTAGLAWRSDSRYFEIRYEDLVRDPDSALERMLRWLDEDFDPCVLSFHESHDERASDVTNPGVTYPVYRQALNRWKTDLPREAAECFTKQAHDLLIELGYAEDESWVSELFEAAEDAVYRRCDT